MNIGTIPAKWARLTPHATAMVTADDGRRITFATLDDRVRRLANGLCDQHGMAVGDRVAVLSRNAVEFQETYFAAGRAGLVAQPLNWRLGVEELARVIADGDPRVVVVADEFHDTAVQLQRHLDVDTWLEYGPDGDGTYEDTLDAASDDEPAATDHVGGDDPFVILSTGGTTGASKGVVHSHRSVQMGALNQTVAERIVPTDVYLLTGQMFHIPVVLSMNYLAHGCPVVLLNFAARAALEVIEAERVSAFLGITTMLNWMMADDRFDQFDLSSLRNIQYGGGPMPSNVVRAALDSFPCTLLQGYGQTEGTTMCFLAPEDHARALAGDHPERLRSCGREGFVTRVEVRDERGRVIPPGSDRAGEIWVRSPANMVGYWNLPDLTRETIVDGWMRTGDVATWDDERYVFIVDRAKDMIISGGENIYSAQVEEAIAHHPAVLEAAVIGVPDDEWGESVMAYVVCKPGHQVTEQDIIDEARRHLASYQKPRAVRFLDALPKAPTGKIRKRDLRAPHWDDAGRTV